ncbi:hypothetical protein [Xanthomarina sp. F2636L]|uniref:hypothetical protein n=1 Tax=Xanthomarina sp. F2636L TaxID=2996018 RepID=UPI00225DE816|nr:hypothetical protein [Xanthomarina sp. F2636L]MCX7552132.1 hypothetical protein [Xanthomarina sp. F2636L]
MKKSILFLIIITLAFSCKNEKPNSSSGTHEKAVIEKIADEAGKIFSEKVYEIKKNGEKGNLVFIIEGTKLFVVKKNGEKEGLFLEKRGNKVYDFSNGQSGSSAVFIFEGNKYWEIDKKTGNKNNLVFERKGDIIYQAGKKGMLEAYLVE